MLTVEEKELEADADARARLAAEIAEACEAGSDRAGATADVFRDELRVAMAEVNGDHREATVRAIFDGATRRVTQGRQSLLQCCQTLDLPDAELLLRRGSVLPSRFGTWCPVALREGTAVRPLSHAENARWPVIYRQRLYFTGSSAARTLFVADPVRYLRQAAPLGAARVQVAVLGPPKSGRSTLARRLCDRTGAAHVTVGSALGYVLETMPTCELALALTAALRKVLARLRIHTSSRPRTQRSSVSHGHTTTRTYIPCTYTCSHSPTHPLTHPPIRCSGSSRARSSGGRRHRHATLFCALPGTRLRSRRLPSQRRPAAGAA